MNEEIKIYLEVIDQIFEIEKKLGKISETNTIERFSHSPSMIAKIML